MKVIVEIPSGTTLHINGIPVESAGMSFVRVESKNVPLLFPEPEAAKASEACAPAR